MDCATFAIRWPASFWFRRNRARFRPSTHFSFADWWMCRTPLTCLLRRRFFDAATRRWATLWWICGWSQCQTKWRRANGWRPAFRDWKSCTAAVASERRLLFPAQTDSCLAAEWCDVCVSMNFPPHARLSANRWDRGNSRPKCVRTTIRFRSHSTAETTNSTAIRCTRWYPANRWKSIWWEKNQWKIDEHMSIAVNDFANHVLEIIGQQHIRE